MPCNPRALLRVLFFVGVAALFSGCVTSKKYKMVKKDTVPAQPVVLDLTSANKELTLATVIVVKGPGSWKREAKWDEYVVTLANHGDHPLIIESAELFDLKGAPQRPGTDPWKLEKLSASNWNKYGSTGVQVLAGAGLVATYVGIEVGVAMGGMMGGSAVATGGAAVALAVIPVFAVVDLTAVAIMNHNNKKKVVAEFDRRRLVLPLTIAPGASVAGSFFFPMTPGPQSLAVHGRKGDQPMDLQLELKPLAELHLKPKEKKAK
jgi:hypothetical protein